MRTAGGDARVTLFAFYGTFMRDQPGHSRLARAKFVAETLTVPHYRLYVIDGRWPAVVPNEDGVAIVCELYEAPEELLAELAGIEPAGWARGPLELTDGRTVEAFVGGQKLAVRGIDISVHGGWAAYVRSIAYQTTSEPCQNVLPR